MSKSILSITLGLGMLLATAAVFAQEPATNATLKDVGGKGKVLVNTGEEFVPAAPGMRLKPGDRVMAQDDSKVDIQFDDECAYKVDENRIVTIPAKSPCAGGVPLVQALDPVEPGAVGAVAGASPVPVFTGMAIESLVYYLVTRDNDDDEDEDDTVSP